MPILGLENSYRVGQSMNSPLASLGVLIEKIIEAIKRRFFDKPDQDKILQQALALLTADCKPKMTWKDDLNTRKIAILRLFEKHNEIVKNDISDVVIDNIKKLSTGLYLNHAEIVQFGRCAIYPYGK